MSGHKNNYDVSHSVNTTDAAAVNAEVSRIFRDLCPDSSTSKINRAILDLDSLHHGRFPGFHACDTAYHDIQHVLDVTLAMARLMDGCERAGIAAESFCAPLFCLGVVTALFHDCGYVRTLDDTEHRNGGQLTLTHVSRGARFLKKYLPQIGMGDVADIAANPIHFTGYETPVAQIEVPSLRHKLLGNLLGSAEIIAQMSDRCYLEKCRNRLYPEFVAGGIARKRLPNSQDDVLFESGDDLVMKTPQFYEGATRRLELDLGGCHHYTKNHFGGQDLYLKEISKNVRFAQAITKKHDTSALKRIPPETLPVDTGDTLA